MMNKYKKFTNWNNLGAIFFVSVFLCILFLCLNAKETHAQSEYLRTENANKVSDTSEAETDVSWPASSPLEDSQAWYKVADSDKKPNCSREYINVPTSSYGEYNFHFFLDRQNLKADEHPVKFNGASGYIVYLVKGENEKATAWSNWDGASPVKDDGEYYVWYYGLAKICLVDGGGSGSGSYGGTAKNLCETVEDGELLELEVIELARNENCNDGNRNFACLQTSLKISNAAQFNNGENFNHTFDLAKLSAQMQGLKVGDKIQAKVVKIPTNVQDVGCYELGDLKMLSNGGTAQNLCETVEDGELLELEVVEVARNENCNDGNRNFACLQTSLKISNAAQFNNGENFNHTFDLATLSAQMQGLKVGDKIQAKVVKIPTDVQDVGCYELGDLKMLSNGGTAKNLCETVEDGELLELEVIELARNENCNDGNRNFACLQTSLKISNAAQFNNGENFNHTFDLATLSAQMQGLKVGDKIQAKVVKIPTDVQDVGCYELGDLKMLSNGGY